jgi:tetratricopeptide (TPR) repeat protein
LALVDHKGQLKWVADGFRIVQSSAKANGREIGIRGQGPSGRLTFLGFLFLVPEDPELTSEKCRDSTLESEKKDNPTLRIVGTSKIAQQSTPPVALVEYTSAGGQGKMAYMVRGFVAAGDMCGDLEFYSDAPIHTGDPDVKRIFESYGLDRQYQPQFNDVFLYGQVLYNEQQFRASGPIFEKALALLERNPGPNQKTMVRVLTDQAGMSYGMTGDIQKARAIFEAAVAKDPEYPMYYYNLACADAEEKNTAGARKHLQEAFDRKSNVLPGEKMPDPTTDDSFLPYRNDKEFWAFLVSLRAMR